MTKMEMFTALSAIVAESAVAAEMKDELLAGIAHEQELIQKRDARPRGESKTARENAELRESLYSAVVEVGRPVSAKELQETRFVDLSMPKVAQNLSVLARAGKLTANVEKRVTFYSLPMEMA